MLKQELLHIEDFINRSDHSQKGRKLMKSEQLKDTSGYLTRAKGKKKKKRIHK